MESATADPAPETAPGSSTEHHPGRLAPSENDVISSGTFAVPDALENVRKSAPGKSVAEPGSAKVNANVSDPLVSDKQQANSSVLLSPCGVDRKAGYVYEPPSWGLGGVHTATDEAIQRACDHPEFPDLMLEVIREGVVVDQIPLQGRGWWLLGSLKETAHVLYEHPFVSRRHLALQFAAKPPFNLYCIDLQSSYGTVCNGTHLKPHEPFLVYRARAASGASLASANSALIPSPPSSPSVSGSELSGSAPSPVQEDRSEDEPSGQESVFVVGGRENTRRIFVIKKRMKGAQFPFEAEHAPPQTDAPTGATLKRPKHRMANSQQPAASRVDSAKNGQVGKDAMPSSRTPTKDQERQGGAARASSRHVDSEGTEDEAEKTLAEKGEILEGEKGEAFLEELRKAREKTKAATPPSEAVELKRRTFVGKQDDEAAALDEDEEEEETAEERERRERLEANCEAMMFDEDDDFFDRSVAEKTGSDAQRKRKKTTEEPLTAEKLERRVATLKRQLEECSAELARISKRESEKKTGEKRNATSQQPEKSSGNDDDADDSLDAFMKGVEQSLANQERQKVEEQIKTLKAELRGAKRLLAFAKA
ncbi:putative pinA [Neospora caninum Liverpool]|uniref:PinA, putative n=1 Tax=Neospora caninum (strain Liverpool) TaxID=572307 RepID=F0V7X2_NEOCL|nr:putative pinA [Neospora caninum Liverpool]CBZ49813.1 putative pinA [Neospora caninum Liverpool]CEL64402.1 TPA: pinA, putative [Neospora caninum Liverpool]|eukprot:XP_003879848.1 putative pinA [Neospora caninum Liverpool]